MGRIFEFAQLGRLWAGAVRAMARMRRGSATRLAQSCPVIVSPIRESVAYSLVFGTRYRGTIAVHDGCTDRYGSMNCANSDMRPRTGACGPIKLPAPLTRHRRDDHAQDTTKQTWPTGHRSRLTTHAFTPHLCRGVNKPRLAVRERAHIEDALRNPVCLAQRFKRPLF